jgi:ATP/maltotriose-dependent transcriptional regulator MalT
MLNAALLAFANPLLALGVAGLLLFGGALATIITLSTGAIAPLTGFFNALPNLSANMTPLISLVQVLKSIAAISLDDTAKDIRKIVGEIKSLDTERTKAFTAAMSAVTTSIIEVRQAPTAALAAASAAPANTRPGSTTTQIILDSSATRKFFEDVFNEGMAVFVDEAIR